MEPQRWVVPASTRRARWLIYAHAGRHVRLQRSRWLDAVSADEQHRRACLIYRSPRTARRSSRSIAAASWALGVRSFHREYAFPEPYADAVLLDPDNICHIYVSPRQRAQKTFELLFAGLGKIPKHTTTELVRSFARQRLHTNAAQISEWNYGDFEECCCHCALGHPSRFSAGLDVRGNLSQEQESRMGHLSRRVRGSHAYDL